MAWRERLRTASFRGIEFLVDSTDDEHGRRLVPHEYPLRNESYTEDLGRKIRKWTIQGFLLGDDYDVEKRRLTEACEADGAGTLVHPYIGEVQAFVDTFRVSQKKEEGRMVRFTITFVEKGRFGLVTSSTTDTRARVRTRASAAVTRTKVVGAGNIVTAGRPDVVEQEVRQGLGELLDEIQSRRAR